MKKAALILLVLCLLLGVCTACVDRSTPGSTPRESSSSSLEIISSSPAPSEAEEDTAPEPEDADAPDVTSPEEDAPNSSSDGAESSSEEKPLYFRLGPDGEVKALHAGDTLGGWILESYRAVWDEEPDALPTVYEANFTAPADAPMEIACTVYLSPMASEGRVYWFDVAEEDHGKIPVMEGTDRKLWFGAKNSAALSMLEALGNGDRRNCRVAVSRYEYSYLAVAAYDIVDIVWLELE